MMKKTIWISMFLFLFGAIMQAQVKIGGKDSPAKGALLDLNGDYKGGLLLPNVAITNLGVIPAGFTERGGADTAEDLTGMIVWSTDPVNAGLFMWDGENWQSLMCQGGIAPCTGAATAPTAVTIPAGPFANNDVFEVSCTAAEDGTTFFIWTVPAGLSITDGQGTKTILVAGSANTYDKNGFTVFAVNQCGISATADGGTGQIVVKAALGTTPPPSTTIEIPTGGNTELDGGTVSGGNCANYSYQWQVFNSPNWQDITGATEEKYRTPALTAETQYRRVATCGSETVTSATITVTIKQVTEPGSVNASSTTVCSGTPTTLSYTGGSGTTFAWYSGSCGGTSVGTGNSLEVSPIATTTYYGRWESGSSYSDCKQVTVTVNNVPATPGAITLSPTTVNLNGTFIASITEVSGATSYTWTLPSGLTGTSTSRSITIRGATAGTYASGTIKVTATNACGTSAQRSSTAAVTVRDCAAAPATPGAITLSATTVLVNGTFTASIASVPGATSYTWTLPSGLTGSSSGTSITVNATTEGTYAAGQITVQATNSCGTSPTAVGSSSVAVIARTAANSVSSQCSYDNKAACRCAVGVPEPYGGSSLPYQIYPRPHNTLFWANATDGNTDCYYDLDDGRGWVLTNPHYNAYMFCH